MVGMPGVVSLGDRRRTNAVAAVAAYDARAAAAKRPSAPGVVSSGTSRLAVAASIEAAAVDDEGSSADATSAASVDGIPLCVVAASIAACAAQCAADDSDDIANTAALAVIELVRRRRLAVADAAGGLGSLFQACVPAGMWSLFANDADAPSPAQRALAIDLASEERVGAPRALDSPKTRLLRSYESRPSSAARGGGGGGSSRTPIRSRSRFASTQGGSSPTVVPDGGGTPRAPMGSSGRVGLCGDPEDQRRWVKYAALLNAPRTDFRALRKLCQEHGVPMGCRAEVWGLLLQCLPLFRGALLNTLAHRVAGRACRCSPLRAP
jgi:hypothetical protein